MATAPTTPQVDEAEVLSADPSLLHLPEADIDIYVEKLRTRQLFKFLKILTVGAGPILSELNLAEPDQDKLIQDVLAILLISVPEAENEVIDFLKSMVKPTGLIEPERSKNDRQINVDLYTELYDLFDNAEIGDTAALLAHIVKAEAPNLKSLGKQLAAFLPSAAKPTTSSKKRSPRSTPEAS